MYKLTAGGLVEHLIAQAKAKNADLTRFKLNIKSVDLTSVVQPVNMGPNDYPFGVRLVATMTEGATALPTYDDMYESYSKEYDNKEYVDDGVIRKFSDKTVWAKYHGVDQTPESIANKMVLSYRLKNIPTINVNNNTPDKYIVLSTIGNNATPFDVLCTRLRVTYSFKQL